jgi:hypothetical protein
MRQATAFIRQLGHPGSGNHIGRLLRALLIGRAGSPRASHLGGWIVASQAPLAAQRIKARPWSLPTGGPACYTPGSCRGRYRREDP